MNAAIVVDASAVLAIYLEEVEAEAFKAILAGEPCVIGGPSLLEVYMRIAVHHGADRAERYVEFLRDRIDVVALDEAMAVAACKAYGLYGKGLGKGKRALNFGDAMTYAVARARDAALLFKGGDFGRTDVKIHPASVGAA